jgi:hypothetical protein
MSLRRETRFSYAPARYSVALSDLEGAAAASAVMPQVSSLRLCDASQRPSRRRRGDAARIGKDLKPMAHKVKIRIMVPCYALPRRFSCHHNASFVFVLALTLEDDSVWHPDLCLRLPCPSGLFPIHHSAYPKATVSGWGGAENPVPHKTYQLYNCHMAAAVGRRFRKSGARCLP